VAVDEHQIGLADVVAQGGHGGEQDRATVGGKRPARSVELTRACRASIIPINAAS
jgi:hypothetical protein